MKTQSEQTQIKNNRIKKREIEKRTRMNSAIESQKFIEGKSKSRWKHGVINARYQKAGSNQPKGEEDDSEAYTHEL